MANPMKSNLSGKFYGMDCDCGFSAKSHNQPEMEEVVGVHLKRSHPEMKMSSGEIRQKIKPM